MTAADVSEGARPSTRSTPPTPEECAHAAPVRGVMAHEFSPYRGAMGPEGKRRTTMHYGPVVGGLPIAAWHCETCGLLKLDYVDGRKEERRLFPGPQPGLIAVAVAESVAPEARLGRQARVSGLTVPARVYLELAPPRPEPAVTLPELRLPTIRESVDGLVIAGLAATMAGLVALAIGSTYSWHSVSWVGPLAAVTGAVFGCTVLLKIAEASFRHLFPWPSLAPSPGDALGGRPRMDGVAWALVATLSLLALGLTIAGILAVDDWKTPDIERPLVYALIALFVLGTLVMVTGGAARALRGEGEGRRQERSTAADLD